MKLSKYNLVTQDNGTFFVCNTYTGAIFKIDEATANFISNEQIEKLSSDDIQQFIKQIELIKVTESKSIRRSVTTWFFVSVPPQVIIISIGTKD